MFATGTPTQCWRYARTRRLPRHVTPVGLLGRASVLAAERKREHAPPGKLGALGLELGAGAAQSRVDKRRLRCATHLGDQAVNTSNETATFALGTRHVNRLGYGAMQLAGPGVFGPPKDRAQALAVLREAVAQGVNHIDTSDFYGPHVTNQLIREALHPYSDELVLVTKLGARRGTDASWNPAFAPEELKSAVHSNLRNLGVSALDVVNLRCMFGVHGPAEGSLEAPLTVLAELQQQGLVRHIGLSNVTPTQIAEGRRICTIVCVQNHYNLAHRADDALIDELAANGTAYVPFFPLGGFTPLQSANLTAVAERIGASHMQVALAWLLQRSANILLIPGTSSQGHLRENLAAGRIALDHEAITQLDLIGAAPQHTQH